MAGLVLLAEFRLVQLDLAHSHALAASDAGRREYRGLATVGIGTLVQGYTEASNVDAVAEITALIIAQRAYEMNSKVISTADNMLATANQVKA